jgi:hypothetical protein
MEPKARRGIAVVMLILGSVLSAGVLLFSFAAFLAELFQRLPWTAVLAGGQLLIGGSLAVTGLILLIKARSKK